MYESIRNTDPKMHQAIMQELGRQQDTIELIASENFVSNAVLEAAGSILTNKYSEGYPGRRYYGGNEFIDISEELANERAKQLFNADHANVQPHSGSDANLAAYLALLNPGEKVLGMSLSHGGHLTHGHKVSSSGRLFQFSHYGLTQEEVIDYEEVRRIAHDEQPKLIVCGASAYPREIDFGRFREIADEVGAYLMADVAHIAGLIVAGVHQSPFPSCDIVTTTTHKTLRGPRGGLILCKERYAKQVDKAVFPGLQGGPLDHIIAAKSVAFKEALAPDFTSYQRQIVKNAQALARALASRGLRLISEGTDNHLLLVDLSNKGIGGKKAEYALEQAHITVNKNTIPFETRSPMDPSGIRLGTPAITTRGMKEDDMEQVADFIDEALANPADEQALSSLRSRVTEFMGRFPIYRDHNEERS